MIDFHTHILPQMDDGSHDLTEALAMLQMSEKSGVSKMFATPHFYAAKEPVERFLRRRQEALEILKEGLIKEGRQVKILPGAEISLFNGLADVSGLAELALGGSDYILIEMPMGTWFKSTYDALYAVMLQTGLTPVIAHIDRYLSHREDTVKIKELLAMGAVLQMNSRYLLHLFTRKKAAALIRQNAVSLLGSDCHNTVTRPPNLAIAWEIAKRLCGEARLSEMLQLSNSIFESAQSVGSAPGNLDQGGGKD